MKFKQFNNQEREAYKRGKIAGYYSRKAHERRCSKKTPDARSPKYSEHTSGDAFERALLRTYQNK